MQIPAVKHAPGWLLKLVPVAFFAALIVLGGATSVLSAEVHKVIAQSLALWWLGLKPMIGRILVAGLFASVINLLYNPFHNRVEKWLTRLGASKRDHDIAAWVTRVGYWALLILGVSGIVNLDIFKHVVTSAGLVTAVVAFAMKDTANDFLSGVYMRFNPKVDLGDFIVVVNQNVQGRVVEFAYVNTTLEDKNGTQYLVPNRVFWGVPLGIRQPTGANSEPPAKQTTP